MDHGPPTSLTMARMRQVRQSGPMDFDRPFPPDPYSLLPVPATFTLTSTDLVDGERMPDEHTARGKNRSPALAWSGFPRETQSFVVSCYDPDAPSPSGYWHWNLLDVPANVTSLPTNAGAPDGSGLPGGAFHVTSDGHEPGYEGGGPPAGDHPHRYIFAVHALDVPSLAERGLTPDATNAQVGVNVFFHALARATLMVTYTS